ncbi:MAG TPA: hypothetical protein VMY88_04925 [Acidimicrobiales bacterium]|nr:hypothetical protein [Acidimicrobiales bacterium]
MTKDKDFKQLARARSARTGESYTTARRNLAAKSAESAKSPRDYGREYWFSRASKGYSGKGAKPTGFERVQVVLADGVITHVTCQAAFRNYGVHRYDARGARAGRSGYIYRGNQIAVGAEQAGSAWCGSATELPTADNPREHEFSFDLPDGPEVLPSLLARFLPVTLPRDDGDLAEYVPVPEDGLPGWRPTTLKSWFPLMGASRESLITPRLITCGGLVDLKVGRKTVQAYRYDHVDRYGKVHATTWIGEDDEVIQYEQTGLLLKALPEEEARKLDPGELD